MFAIFLAIRLRSTPPQNVKSAPSLTVFRKRLKSEDSPSSTHVMLARWRPHFFLYWFFLKHVSQQFLELSAVYYWALQDELVLLKESVQSKRPNTVWSETSCYLSVRRTTETPPSMYEWHYSVCSSCCSHDGGILRCSNCIMWHINTLPIIFIC